MNPTKLDGRLSLCAEFVRMGSRLADIGTDHGYLPIALLSRGVVPFALACDINPLPLRSAQENIALCGLSDRIQTRLCDGLSGIGADEVDDIVIAGMGGELIAQILSDCEWIRDPEIRLILQPMTRYEKLIRRLYENGFAITAQKACKADGKLYTVLCASYSGVREECDPLRSYTGALDMSDETARAFLQKTAERLRKQANGDPTLLPVAGKIEEML